MARDDFAEYGIHWAIEMIEYGDLSLASNICHQYPFIAIDMGCQGESWGGVMFSGFSHHR
jgi:hypothetical protein